MGLRKKTFHISDSRMIALCYVQHTDCTDWAHCNGWCSVSSNICLTPAENGRAILLLVHDFKILFIAEQRLQMLKSLNIDKDIKQM